MSTSTGAPAALARSEGWKLLTKGTAVKPAPTAPAQPDAISHVRLLASTGVSLMGVLEDLCLLGSTRDCSGPYLRDFNACGMSRRALRRILARVHNSEGAAPWA